MQVSVGPADLQATLTGVNVWYGHRSGRSTFHLPSPWERLLHFSPLLSPPSKLCTYCHSWVRFYCGHINSLLPQPAACQREVTQERFQTLLYSQVIFVLPLLDLQPWYGRDRTFLRISSLCVGSMVNHRCFCSTIIIIIIIIIILIILANLLARLPEKSGFRSYKSKSLCNCQSVLAL